jgi:uncharacterized membrane protein/uncharacterized protein YegL
LSGVANQAGFHQYRAELVASGSVNEEPRNDVAYAYTRVKGESKVLIVEPRPGYAEQVAQALSSSNISFDRVVPEQLPYEAVDYAAYDSLILNNVPATRFAARQMEELARSVSDLGVGLVSIGGEEAYGLGGYYKTPLEEALPVYMDLRGKKEMPTLGMVFVIDRSGSMSDDKLELAKEAALRAVEILRPEDNVGVIAFSGEPQIVQPLTELTDKEGVMKQILSIQVGGGTNIYPAVKRAYDMLAEADVQRKHIILLSDGQSGTTSDYNQILQAMNNESMTMSTVSIGAESDQELLETLANGAGGRYYYTQDESTIPTIFSREAVLVSQTYIVDEEFVPSLGQAGNWNTLLAQGVPAVQAYVATTPKERAEVALWTAQSDPLLSRWQYGAGRAVSWSSDLTGRWAPQWITWDGFANTFSQLVKWTYPQFRTEPYDVRLAHNGSSTTLRLTETATDPSSNVTPLTLNLSDADQVLRTYQALPVKPGEYEVDIPQLGTGVYMLGVRKTSNTATADSASDDAESPAANDETASQGGAMTALVMPYSAEYRIDPEARGRSVLTELAEATGGRVLTAEDARDYFSFTPAKVRTYTDMTTPLLLFVILLWLLDIALRRLAIPWRAWYSWLVALPAGLQRRKIAAGEVASTFERLSQRKARTDARIDRGGAFADAVSHPSAHTNTAPERRQTSAESSNREGRERNPSSDKPD